MEHQKGDKHAADFTIREAIADDANDLAAVHVTTFNETHGIFPSGPSYKTRKWQWDEAFATADGTWFCFVVISQEGELIGFAKGQPYSHDDQPDFSGELNKIYLLKRYHRLGLGKRLLAEIAKRFIIMNINSMVLFGDAANASNHFYEAMGAEKLFAKNGEFHGGYGWRNLQELLIALQ